MRRKEAGSGHSRRNRIGPLAVVGLIDIEMESRELERIGQIDATPKKESEAPNNRSCLQLRGDRSLRSIQQVHNRHQRSSWTSEAEDIVQQAPSTRAGTEVGPTTLETVQGSMRVRMITCMSFSTFHTITDIICSSTEEM